MTGLNVNETMFKKFRISLISSNLVVAKTLNPNHHMHYLYANFVIILDVCKSFSTNLVKELGDIPRCGIAALILRGSNSTDGLPFIAIVMFRSHSRFTENNEESINGLPRV